MERPFLIRNQFLLLSCLFFLMNLGLRLLTIGESGLYLDESVCVYYSRLDWTSMMEYAQRDANPPLYWACLWVWSHLGSDSIEWARGLSALFMALSGMLIFRIGARIFSARTGIQAAALFLLANLAQQYGQEARGFALVTFGAMLALEGWLRHYEGNSRFAWLQLALGLAITWNVHYASLAFAGGLFLVGLLRSGVRPKIHLKPVLAYALAGLTLLPDLLSLTAKKMGSQSSWMKAPNLERSWEFYLNFWPSDLLGILFPAIVLLPLLLLWLLPGRERKEIFIAVRIFLVSLLAMLIGSAVSKWVPMLLPKYFLFLLPLFILAFCGGMERLTRPKWLNWGAFLLVLFVFGTEFNPVQYKEERWKIAVEWVKEHKDAEACVIVSPSYQYRSFAYYFERESFRDPENLHKNLQEQNIFFVNDLDSVFFEKNPCEKLIYLRSHRGVIDPDENILKLIEEYLPLQEERDFANIWGYLYRPD